MSEKYDLYSKFDIEKHKQTYVNYLEVMIFENGMVQYAVPSHQEFAITIACEKLHVSRQQLMDLCPPEYYGDFLYWLSSISGLMAVWNQGCLVAHPTQKQIAMLRRLKLEGLYKGVLPKSAE